MFNLPSVDQKAGDCVWDTLAQELGLTQYAWVEFNFPDQPAVTMLASADRIVVGMMADAHEDARTFLSNLIWNLQVSFFTEVTGVLILAKGWECVYHRAACVYGGC